MVNLSALTRYWPQRRLASWAAQQSVALVIACVICLATIFLKWQSLWMPENTTVPTLQAPSPNARDFYTAAGKLLRDEKAIAWAIDKPVAPDHLDVSKKASVLADWTSGYHHFTAAEKQGLVRENAPALAKLREGMKYAYLDLRAPSFEASFLYYREDREMGRLLILEGNNHAAAGDWNGAEGAYLDAFKFGTDLPHGSGVPGAWVGIVVEIFAQRQFQKVIPYLDAGQAERAIRQIQKLDATQVTPAEVLQNEKRWTQGALLNDFQKPHWRQVLLQYTGRQEDKRLTLQIESPRTAYDVYSHYMDHAITQSRLPWTKFRQTTLPQPKDPINRILANADAELVLRSIGTLTFHHLIETELALRAYQQEHGAFPDDLAALAPKYLPSVPTDPFSDNRPLRYRRQGTNYLLYSVGPDAKDDGGVPMTNIGNPYANGDAVAGVSE